MRRNGGQVLSEKKKDKSPSWFARTLIRLNNYRKHKNNFNVSPERVLLLLPRCIQDSNCGQNIVHDIHNCKRCGNCPVKNMIELCEEYGVIPKVANGGRLALSMVLEAWVDAVVAVACEVELKEGILKSPKPVLAVINTRPQGPCVNTLVEVEQVREAIRIFIGEVSKQGSSA